MGTSRHSMIAPARWITACLIFVHFLSLVSRGMAQEQPKITCEAPPQPEGSLATLTCDFKKNINTSIAWLVNFYGWDDDGVPYIVYYNGESQVPSSPYQLLDTVGSVSRYTQITFNASRQRTGYYTCADDKRTDMNICQFNLSFAIDNEPAASQADAINGTVTTGFIAPASNTNVETDGTYTIIIIITLAAALIIVIAVLVAMVICRHRKQKTMKAEVASSGSKVATIGNSIDQEDIIGHLDRHDEHSPPLAAASGAVASEGSSGVEMHTEDRPDHFPDYDSGIQLSVITNHSYTQESKASEDFTSVDWKSTPNKVTADLILKPFLDKIEEQWKLIQTKKASSEKHHTKIDSLETKPNAGSEEKDYISNTYLEERNIKIHERTPLCQQDNKPARKSETGGTYTTTPPKPTDWPPCKDLHGQNLWIVSTLMPYVGCPMFPSHTEEAKRELADLLEVQILIKCRLEELEIYTLESCSTSTAELKESVIVKLRTAQKMADIRHSAIKTLYINLVKTDQHVKNAADELSSLMGDSQ